MPILQQKQELTFVSWTDDISYKPPGTEPRGKTQY
jgi:hypothetical protein